MQLINYFLSNSKSQHFTVAIISYAVEIVCIFCCQRSRGFFATEEDKFKSLSTNDVAKVVSGLHPI